MEPDAKLPPDLDDAKILALLGASRSGKGPEKKEDFESLASGLWRILRNYAFPLAILILALTYATTKLTSLPATVTLFNESNEAVHGVSFVGGGQTQAVGELDSGGVVVLKLVPLRDVELHYTGAKSHVRQFRGEIIPGARLRITIHDDGRVSVDKDTLED